MGLWDSARKVVADIFFYDKVEIYKNDIVTSELGEETNSPVLLGTYPCNIQNTGSQTSHQEAGTSLPASIRISLAKSVAFPAGKTLSVKINQARIAFDANQWWKVDSTVEGQISTVLTASKEVVV